MNDAGDELLTSFHHQFAENQNHHQNLFVKFISVIFVVIIAYGLVYVNTGSEAKLFEMQPDSDKNVKSYAIIHLIESFFVSQTILSLLCVLIINIGYGYRRDQLANENIRKYFLDLLTYKKIFGDKHFIAKGKPFIDFLPTFNLSFVIFLIVLQIAFDSSWFVISPHSKLTINGDAFAKMFLTTGLSAPFVSFIFWGKFFYKYKKL